MSSIFDNARSLLNIFQPKLVSPQPKPRVQRWVSDHPGFKLSQIAMTPYNMVQQAIEKPPTFNFSQNIKNPVKKVGAQIAEGVLNQPARSIQAAGRIGSDIKFGTTTPTRFIGNVAEAAMLPLSFVGGPGAAKTVGKALLKPTAAQAISKAATLNAGIGAGFGLLQGLADNRNAPNVSRQIFDSAPQIYGGAAIGGVLGGAGAGIGHLAGKYLTKSPEVQSQLRDKAGRWVAGERPVKPKGMTSAQWNFQLKFNQKNGRNPYTPVYIQDLAAELPQPGLTTKSKTKFSDALEAKQQNLSTELPQSAKSVPGESPLNTGATRSTKTLPISSSSTEEYIRELTGKQREARSVGPSGLKQKAGSVLADLKAKLVDETSPITDPLSAAEKKHGFQVLPKQDIRLQIDRVLRSKTLASQFAEDNGLVGAIKQAPDIDALDQYMIAKQAAAVEKRGIKTGRDLARDQQLIQDLAPEYEAHAQAVNQYSRKLLDYSVKSGLIDKNLAAELIKKYPEYVPLNRVFNELEKGSFRGTGKGVASLSKQTVVQGLKGSEREITSPIESLLLKTQDAFSQGERNIAARQLASYKDLPGFEGLISEVKDGARNPHTFSYIDNGVKKTFATSKEFSEAAKSLNVEQMGLLGKILSAPTRLLQLGATGLNVPFVATNLFKDEITGFINSNKAASTSILNPTVYVKSLFSAVKHDELYKDMIRSAGGGTSFDIAREAPNLAVKKLRSPVSTTVKNPMELLRAIENAVGRSEEFGRIKNFQGTKQALLKEGRTLEDANLLAAKASRENTANFARRGSYGRVLNWIIPFFNAGVQGSRQLVRSFQNAPVQTSSKVALTIFTPIAAATAWNLSDPQRKQIYSDIPDYEKQNNIILIPENPTQDKQGRWNVIKIPLPPGLSNLGTLVRRPMEQAADLDPVRFGEVAANLITAGTSIDISSPNKLASTFTPQIIKPVVEGVTNTNLFTGRQIIPEYLKNKPAELQTKPGVSPVATGIGKALNISPLMVENFASSQLGGLGSQLLGKENAVENIQRRFGKASGGVHLDKIYSDSGEQSKSYGSCMFP